MSGSLPPLQLFVLCAGTWLCTVAATLAGKCMFQVKVQGGKFNKPLTSSIFVAAAMATSLIVWFAQKMRAHDSTKEKEPDGDAELREALLEMHKDAAVSPRSNRAKAFMLRSLPLIPLSMMDLGTTISICTAYLYAPASVVRMIASSGIIFTAILTRVILGTRYTSFQWFGVLLAVAGLSCTGLSALLPQKHQQKRVDYHEYSQQQLQQQHHGSSIWLGVGMALLATCLSTTQQVMEEKFLKEKRFTPLQQVGIEGSLELTMLSVILPLVNHLHGSDGRKVEDVTQALSQIRHSPILIGLALGMWASLALANPLEQSIARYSGTVLRCLVGISSSLGVWGGGILTYSLTSGVYGEWLHKNSWLQLLGFGFICVGLVAFTKGAKAKGDIDKARERREVSGGELGNSLATATSPA